MIIYKSRFYEKNIFNSIHNINSGFSKICKECEYNSKDFIGDVLSFEIYYMALKNNIGMIRWILFLSKKYKLYRDSKELITNCLLEGATNGNNTHLLLTFWEKDDIKIIKRNLTGALEFQAYDSVDFYIETIERIGKIEDVERYLLVSWINTDKKSEILENFVKARGWNS